MRGTNSKNGLLAALVLVAMTVGMSACAQPSKGYEIGRPATPSEVDAWNLDVAPDGKGLPQGSGTVAQGMEIYAAQCAACHGANGEGGLGDRLTGGMGTLNTGKPVRTVGSYWPYATTLFDYTRRAMPLHAPQSLTASEVYAVTGYVLYLNGLLPQTATLDARSLPAVKMPNRDGFIEDTRPDVKSTSCYKDCGKK